MMRPRHLANVMTRGSNILGRMLRTDPPPGAAPIQDDRAAARSTISSWAALVCVLAAALVFVPPVVYQAEHFYFGWWDIGNYTRANYNFFEFGRFAILSDGSGDFFAEQHFEPFFFLLCIPIRLFGTAGYVGAVTAALVLAAGYVYVLTAAVTRSSSAAALCTAAYIVNPYTYAIVLNYHPETFGILFLLAFAYHSYVRQGVRAWLALGLACLVKEDMWVYACAVALLVGQRSGWTRTAACVAGAVVYWVVAVQLIGGSLYPSAKYFNAFYGSEGHPLTKLEIAGLLLGRWREFPALLFSGPGLLFQLSFLFVGVFSGWRYALACGVALLWLTYPGGPPRSNFALYYSYSALLVSYVALPFALVRLRSLGGRVASGANADRYGRWAVTIAMVVMISTDVIMHVPGYQPPPIAESVDLRSVFGPGRGVNIPVVRWLISAFLDNDTGSVMSQCYIIPSLPQHRPLYPIFFHRAAFLEGRLKPKYVLLDLGSPEPWVPEEDRRAIVTLLRSSHGYSPLYDSGNVLLYRRRAAE